MCNDKNNILIKSAHLLSGIFSPLIVPTYCVAITFLVTKLNANPITVRLSALIMVFAITCMLPIIGIYVLYRLGRITDARLNAQAQRTFPYIIAILCYIGCAIYFGRLHAPWWLPTFIIGAAIAVLATVIINLRWKISAHATAMGGMVALLFILWSNDFNVVPLMPLISVATILAGLVGSARMLLGYHTLTQVLAGFVNGILWMSITIFLYPLLFSH